MPLDLDGKERFYAVTWVYDADRSEERVDSIQYYLSALLQRCFMSVYVRYINLFGFLDTFSTSRNGLFILIRLQARVPGQSRSPIRDDGLQTPIGTISVIRAFK